MNTDLVITRDLESIVADYRRGVCALSGEPDTPVQRYSRSKYARSNRASYNRLQGRNMNKSAEQGPVERLNMSAVAVVVFHYCRTAVYRSTGLIHLAARANKNFEQVVKRTVSTAANAENSKQRTNHVSLRNELHNVFAHA